MSRTRRTRKERGQEENERRAKRLSCTRGGGIEPAVAAC